MSKVKYSKKFEVCNEDEHKTYLVTYPEGHFTIGEIFGNTYHVIMSVRGDDVPKIIELLNDPDTWEFPDLGLPEGVVVND